MNKGSDKVLNISLYTQGVEGSVHPSRLQVRKQAQREAGLCLRPPKWSVAMVEGEDFGLGPGKYLSVRASRTHQAGRSGCR